MSSLMLQYPTMKHTEKTTKWEVMTCKNSITSTNRGIYENYIANAYPLIVTMPEMDQYQKETFNP